MDSYLTALKAYIEAQREYGVSDDMIYQSLISSGWQKETITQALSAQSANVVRQSAVQHGNYQPSTGNSVAEQSDKKNLSSGRLNRLGFFMAHVYIVAYFALAMIIVLLGQRSNITNAIGFLMGGIGVLIVMILPFFFYARRWHDINQSGWLSLLLLIPGAAVIIAVVLMIIPGTQGDNQYGTAPQKALSPIDVYGFGK